MIGWAGNNNRLDVPGIYANGYLLRQDYLEMSPYLDYLQKDPTLGCYGLIHFVAKIIPTKISLLNLVGFG